MDHRVIGVVGASGGLGASTLAVALAVRAARRFGVCACVDGTGWGGGLDVTACLEHLPGLRLGDLAGAAGALDGAALLRALPSQDGIAVLAPGRPPDHTGGLDGAGGLDRAGGPGRAGGLDRTGEWGAAAGLGGAGWPGRAGWSDRAGEWDAAAGVDAAGALGCTDGAGGRDCADGEPGAGLVVRAVHALASLCAVTVVDLGRPGWGGPCGLVEACTEVVLVAGTSARQLADAVAAAAQLGGPGSSAPTGLVLRPARRDPVEPEDVAVRLDLPLLAVVPDDARVATDADRARTPGTRAASRLAVLADRVLDWVELADPADLAHPADLRVSA